MGMFDTFESSNNYKCGSCNFTFTLPSGVQSKSFECNLDYFKNGDLVPDISDKRVIVGEYEWCPNCDEEVDLFLSFHKGIYVGCFNYEESAEMASEHFDMLTAYKHSQNERVKFENKFTGMKRDLEYTHELHSKGFTKKLSPFLMLRNMDILDYNIVTTIQNILNKYKD